MSPKTKHTLKNRLWQARRRAGLGQKQVAALINQRTPNQISQYEIGARIPNLQTVLRLSIIYQVPVRSLFFGLYQNLQEELLGKNSLEKKPESESQKKRDLDEYCTFEQLLENAELTEEEYEKAKKHSIKMVNKTSEIQSRRYSSV